MVAGATVRAEKEILTAKADARVVPEDAGPVWARERVRAKKAGARADNPGNYNPTKRPGQSGRFTAL